MRAMLDKPYKGLHKFKFRYIRPTELKNALATPALRNWVYNSKTCFLTRRIEFANFEQAVCFMSSFAKYQFENFHHAVIDNVYNKVDIRLVDIETENVTDKDLYLALAAETIVRKMPSDLKDFRKVIEFSEEEMCQDT